MIQLLLTVLLVAAEIAAARFNAARNRAGVVTKSWLTAYKYRWLPGIPCAVVSALIRYPAQGESGGYIVYGFPLVAAAFDEAGRDYVSPLTGVLFLGNAVIWYFLPYLLLAAWAILDTRYSASRGSSG